MATPMIEYFDRKVAEMKAEFSALPNICAFGQFQVSSTVFTQLGWLVRAELMPDWITTYSEVWNLYIEWAKLSVSATRRAACKKITDLIKANGWELFLPRTLAAFSLDPGATAAWASGAYAAMWTSPGLSGVPYFALPTADKYFAAWNYEKDRCGYTASYMASKIMQVKRLTLKPSTANLYTAKLGGASWKGGGQRDVLTYDPTKLPAEFDKIKAAIGRGYLYQMGVLSGARFDGGVLWPRPEHYVLAFACFDNALLFWDPDAGVSHIASRPWGQGFGVLYHSDNRLSTAYDAADFSAVSLVDDPKTGKVYGDHLQSRRRHCYQAFTANPRP